MQRKIFGLTAAILISGVTLPAMADTETLFYCITEDSKELRLLAEGDDLIYQYGDNIDVPELVLRSHRDEVGVRDRLLPGPIWQQSLTFSNGQWDYVVVVEAHRPIGGPGRDLGGVEVYQHKNQLADKNCTPKNMIQRLLVVEGIQEEWGYYGPDINTGRQH